MVNCVAGERSKKYAKKYFRSEKEEIEQSLFGDLVNPNKLILQGIENLNFLLFFEVLFIIIDNVNIE